MQQRSLGAPAPLPVQPPSAGSFIGQAPRLMRAGILVSHAFLLLAAAAGYLLAGTDMMLTTVLAGLTVSVLLILGQYLQMLLVRRADLMAMAATLAGFGIRVVALGAGLAIWLSAVDRYPVIRPWGVLVGVTAVTVGWLVGVLATYRRLRIPIFDEPEPPAAGDQSRGRDE